METEILPLSQFSALNSQFMYSITDLKTGTKITLGNDPYVVLKYDHIKMGRGGAVVKATVQNLRTGQVRVESFSGTDKVEPAEIIQKRAQYTYNDGANYYFMNEETFDQFEFSKEILGDTIYFLLEGNTVDVMYYNGNPINVSVKPKVELKVVDTPPGVRGDTATGGSKPATLETGLVVTVPLFINIGDVLRINTETMAYVERA